MNASDAGRLPPFAALRWTARVLLVLLLLVWGAFFAEHSMAWFSAPGPMPPPRIAWIHLAHLVMLAGFAAAWRWELAGSILVVVGALAFFSQAAGRSFPLFFGTAILPAVLLLICRLKGRRG